MDVRSVASLAKTSDWLSGLKTSWLAVSPGLTELTAEAAPAIETLTSDVVCAARSRTYTYCGWVDGPQPGEDEPELELGSIGAVVRSSEVSMKASDWLSGLKTKTPVPPPSDAWP